MPTYWVATTGSNSNDGSEGSPWLTLAFAWSQIVSNDIIRVKAGTYTLTSQLTLNGSKTGVTITADVPATKPIITKATEGLVRIAAGTDDLTLSYLQIEMAARRTAGYFFGNVFCLAARTIIDNCHIQKGWIGVELRGGAGNIIRNCEIHDHGTVDTTPETGNGFGVIHYTEGGTAWTPGNYDRIHDNLIYDCGGDSYQCDNAAGTKYVEFDHNDCHSNGEDGVDLKDAQFFRIHHNLIHDCAGDGIVSHAAEPADDIEIYNNKIYGNNWWGIFLAGNCDRWSIQNNVIYDNATDQGTYSTLGVQMGGTLHTFYHNTVYNNGRAGIKSAAGHLVKNNAFFENGAGSNGNIDAASGGTIDTNYVYPTSPGITGTNPVTDADPKFKDVAARDFHLLSGSPLINAGLTGLGVTTDYDDAARDSQPDLGAFESGALTRPPVTVRPPVAERPPVWIRPPVTSRPSV